MVMKRYTLSFGILVWHGGIEATGQVRPVAAVIQRWSGKDRERGWPRIEQGVYPETFWEENILDIEAVWRQKLRKEHQWWLRSFHFGKLGILVIESLQGWQCRTQASKAHNWIHQLLECPLYKTNRCINIGKKGVFNPMEEKKTEVEA